MDYGTPKGAAPDDIAQIHMAYQTPVKGLRQTIWLRSIWIMRRPKGALRQTIELRSIWIMITKSALRQTMELRSIRIKGRPQGAAPDDRAQIQMDNETPKGGCARR